MPLSVCAQPSGRLPLRRPGSPNSGDDSVIQMSKTETASFKSKFAKFRKWFSSIHIQVVAIEDTPHSIAMGLAIGIFFGFTPLWSLKTLLSIAVAWLFKSNKIAAAIAVTLHDIILPFMPAIYWWEYKIGYWIIHGAPPQRIRIAHIAMQDYLHSDVFVRLIWPTLVGSLSLAIPSAIATYLVMRMLVSRARSEEPSVRTN